jgi:hypothetical protein
MSAGIASGRRGRVSKSPPNRQPDRSLPALINDHRTRSLQVIGLLTFGYTRGGAIAPSRLNRCTAVRWRSARSARGQRRKQRQASPAARRNRDRSWHAREPDALLDAPVDPSVRRLIHGQPMAGFYAYLGHASIARLPDGHLPARCGSWGSTATAVASNSGRADITAKLISDAIIQVFPRGDHAFIIERHSASCVVGRGWDRIRGEHVGDLSCLVLDCASICGTAGSSGAS